MGGRHLWRETPLYTEEAEAPGWRFCAVLLLALADARAALLGGGDALLLWPARVVAALTRSNKFL